MNGYHDLSDPKLQSILELLSSDLEQVFLIPPYQRHFIWDKKRIQILYRDLFPDEFWKNLHNQAITNQKLFIGCVVLCRGAASAPVEVIDGQQRLIILSLSLMEILRRLSELKDKDEDLEENIVAIRQALRAGSSQVPLSERKPRLTLKSDDSDVWKAICAGQPIAKFAKGESKPLVDAHRFVREEIKDLLDDASENKVGTRDALMIIATRILRQTSLIRFETTDKIQAFILFETLNYRGVPLNAADLTKNKTLALSQRHGQNFFDKCNAIWEDMTKTLGRDNLETFLHHYWIGHHESTGKLKLFEKVSEYISLLEKKDLLAFLEDLQESAAYYKELMRPVVAGGANKAERKRVFQLLRISKLKAQTCRIVLLYARSHFPEQEGVLLDLVEAITLRGLTESILPRDIDKAYKDACADCREDKKKSIESTLKSRIKAYTKGINFEGDFANLEFPQNSDKVRIILARLNETYAGGSEIDFYKADSVDIEHIFSRNANTAAKKESGFTSKTKFKENIYRIGNLTLWYNSDNRKYQNGPYSKKRKEYRSSKFDLTKQVGDDVKKWNASAIDARCEKLASLAGTTWPLNI